MIFILTGGVFGSKNKYVACVSATTRDLHRTRVIVGFWREETGAGDVGRRALGHQPGISFLYYEWDENWVSNAQHRTACPHRQARRRYHKYRAGRKRLRDDDESTDARHPRIETSHAQSLGL